MYNITFQQIEAFLAIAKHLNMTKAGKATSISQSALSKILKKFEESVGMQLFTRSNLGMALTNAGKELYAVLEPQYRALDRGIWLVQNNMTPQAKVLRIAEPSSYNYAEEFDQLKDIVSRYTSKYPDVEIQELQYDFSDMRQALEYGVADLVFSQEFGIMNTQNTTLRRVTEIDMYIAMSGEHPLAESDELDMTALDGEVFLTTRNTGNVQTDIEGLENVCIWLGFTPKTVICLPNFQTFLHAIKQGNGMGICGRFKNIGLDSDIKYFPVSQLRGLYVVVGWKTGMLKTEAKSFIKMLPDNQ
ncbi:MAG: LysR family transcriptional regulator [Clostridiales bacterium]|nr:LysR family transcriptional regulator [Clostridiales bacterium]